MEAHAQHELEESTGTNDANCNSIEEKDCPSEVNGNQETIELSEKESKARAEEVMAIGDDSNSCPIQSTDTVEQIEQYYQQSSSTETDVTKEAEEIVQKLCKNGKIMQFQEGEDFIKVIVYEDSTENQDNENTTSADEDERENESLSDSENQNNDRLRPRNLLECLTESQEQFLRQQSNTQTSMAQSEHRSHAPRFENWMPAPRDPRASFAESRAEAVQSSFSHAGTPFAPGFLPNTASYTSAPYVPQVPSSQVTNPHLVGGVPQQTVMCTPHPSTGYMFYVADDKGQRRTPLTNIGSNNSAFTTPVSALGSRTVTPKCPDVRLNSSGEEISPPATTSTPTSGYSAPNMRNLIPMPQFEMDDGVKMRELHNQKERRRRARIKEACNLLRQLVPGMSDKTDKATVFEFAARYVHFLKSHTGNPYDKDFLMKYSPY